MSFTFPKTLSEHKMLGIIVLTLLAGALSAPTTQPGASTTLDLLAIITTSFNAVDADSNGQLEVSEFYKIFDKYDTDHDHKLTIHEYVSGTQANKAVAREVFKFVDHDHDNVLTRGETNRVFRIYDTDHDGTITIREYIHEYKTVYQHVIKDLQHHSHQAHVHTTKAAST
ncbi:calcineurin subunit B type 2-like isoform X1 [Haliotis cracherodii]|uniref:calcineurin subunit B type 2-like isoform X1 n=1 Tax=Haliotis cracherodii TaxID=6455 RepID=UPI0039EBBEC1